MSEEWGPWIEHDGKGCPCVGMYVQVDGHCGWWGNIKREEGIVRASAIPCWEIIHPEHGPEVIRYRIRKPRGMQTLTEILNEVTDKPRVDA